MITETYNGNFSIREGNFEVRFGHANLFNPDKLTPELIKWFKKEDGTEYCITLALWNYNSKEPDWSMESVGERIFSEIPTNLVPQVWNLMRTMDCYLNKEEE